MKGIVFGRVGMKQGGQRMGLTNGGGYPTIRRG